MRKYAMIPINSKVNENGNTLIRRVLISYLFKVKKGITTTYYFTKILAKDSYFNNYSSHQYIFKNNYYILKSVKNKKAKKEYDAHPEIYLKRKYHTNLIPAIEFKSQTRQSAITTFTTRKELR